MSYVIKAVLGNARRPEYGQATLIFPILDEEYDRAAEQLGVLKIGDALEKGCHVDQVISDYIVLHRLEGSSVTVDEPDYLAKRLDSFDDGEAEQFQAMAEKLKLSDMADFINLTFCCQQATVIKDFSDLETAGRAHYMNPNGGCAGSEELANLDGCETALLLIDTGTGVVTRYGVVYDNGMKLNSSTISGV